MKLVCGCDHGGYLLMKPVVEYLEKAGYDVNFIGCYGEPCDYPDIAKKAAEIVLNKEADLGILACGTGIGISIAANKIKGIRCALLSDCYSAKMTRLHNNSNMMAMGGRVLGPDLAIDIVEKFINTPFSKEERHQRRIDKLEK